MPSSYVGISDDNGDKLLVSSNGALSTLQAADPTVRGAYVFALTDVAGVVAANTFVSLFNTLGSGRTLGLFAMFSNGYVATTAVATGSLKLERITAASGGVDSSASIVKLATAMPTATAVVRTGGPTITAAGLMTSLPPPLSAGSFTSHQAQAIRSTGPNDATILAPGEGIAVSTAVGDVNQRWGITIGWFEI